MKVFRAVAVLAVLVAGSAWATSTAAQTITFQEVAAGTVVTSEYRSKGVTFGSVQSLGAPALDGAWDCGPPIAVSGTPFDLPDNIAVAPGCTVDSGSLRGTIAAFPASTRSVSTTVGLYVTGTWDGQPPSRTAELRAYAASGNLLTTTAATLAVGSSTTLSITRDAFEIAYVAIQLAGGDNEKHHIYFDDLKFETPELQLSGQNFGAVAGNPFNTVVASFTDDRTLPESSYSATIRWGDGGSSNGRIVRSGDRLNVEGSHTYGADGSYTVDTSLSVSDGRMKTTRSTATVTSAPRPDFTLSVSPANVAVKQGENAAFTVFVAGLNGFSGTISLALMGATGSFAPAAIGPGASAQLTVTPSSKTAPGKYPLTITGTSGSIVRSAGATLDVGKAPAPTLAARFRTRATASTRLAILDARRTIGAVKLRWDVNGDGRDDIECGGKSPFLGARLYRPGKYKVRLTAIAASGRASVTTSTLTVRGPAPPRRVVATTPQVALCAGTESALTLTGRGCADRVVFGIVEVRGCLERVTRREDVPANEARVVDQYYANLQIPKYVQVLCNRGHPSCPDWLAKHSAFELLVSASPVKINGLTFYPRRGGRIVVFPVLERVVSSNAEVALGRMTVKTGSIDLDLHTRYRAFGKSQGGRTDLFSFDPKGLGSIGGFPVLSGNDGRADLGIARRRERYLSTVKLRLALPGVFSAFGGRAPSGEAIVEADNDRGLILDRLHLGLPEAYLGAIRFTGVAFDYSASGDGAANCSKHWWKATANVFLGSTGQDAGFVLSPPPSQNGIAFCNGRFRSAGGAFVFGAQIPPPQLFPGLFLNEVNFAVALDPTLVRGGGVISAAQVTYVRGTLLTVYPSPAAPYVLTTEDAGREFAPLRGRRFVTTTIAMGGTFGFRIPALGNVPFGNAYFLYSYPDYVALGGGMRFYSPGLLVYGTIDGELSLARHLFNFHGNIGAEIAGLPRLGVEGWVTSTGVVVCGSVAGLHPGAGFRWSTSWPQIWLVDGCKPSPYWVQVRANSLVLHDGAWAAPLTFTVQPGERAKNVRVPGVGGAPEVVVRGPDGETVSTAERDFVTGRTLRVLRQEQGRVTWIGVENGRPGRYTVTSLPGSARIASLAATRPHPAAQVRASVAGSGARRTLRYRTNLSARERITFFERGSATYRRLGLARRGRGAIRFTPGPGPAGTRLILAQVQLDGTPAPTLTVARYRAAGPVPIGLPSALRVRRRGTTIVASWGRAAGAIEYGVFVRQRNGMQRLLRLPGNGRSVRVPRVPLTQSGTVSIRARGPRGAWGKARSARFRATREEASRFRSFRELGRRSRR